MELFKMGSYSTNRKEDKEIVAAKIIVYAQEDEEYFTFISKEAYHALKDWMEYRE
jgi:hypothetical protein